MRYAILAFVLILTIPIVMASDITWSMGDSVKVSVYRAPDPCPDKCQNEFHLANGSLEHGICVYETKQACLFACNDTLGCICKEKGEASPTAQECCSGVTINGYCASQGDLLYTYSPWDYNGVTMKTNSKLTQKLTFTNKDKELVWVKLASDSPGVNIVPYPVKVNPHQSIELDPTFVSKDVDDIGAFYIVTHSSEAITTAKIPFKIHLVGCIPNSIPSSSKSDCCSGYIKGGFCQDKPNINWLLPFLEIVGGFFVIFIVFVVWRNYRYA